MSDDPYADMDPSLAELNRMADTAMISRKLDVEPTKDDIARWTRLFNYSHLEARALITEQRNNVTSSPITDSHWELVRAEKEARGYDREAYEHLIQLKDVLQTMSVRVPGMKTDFTNDQGQDGEKDLFMFRLGGLLDSAEKVKEVAGLRDLPRVVKAGSEMGLVELCCVDDEARVRIESWLSERAVLSGDKR